MEICLRDFGVIGDGVTDNAVALRGIRDHMHLLQSQGHQHFNICAEPLHYVYSDNSWLFGLKSFELNAYGAKFQNINTSPQGVRWRAFHIGDIWETNGGEPYDGQELRDGWVFKTENTGSNQITLTTLDGIAEFVEGGRVLLYGKTNQDANSYPPSCDYHEYKTILNADPALGVITFTEPLWHSYDDRWKDVAQQGLPPFGLPRIVPLDRPDYNWPELVIMRGFKTIHNPNQLPDRESMGLPGRRVVLEDVTATYVFPSEAESWEAKRCNFKGIAFDKMIRHSRAVDCKISFDVQDGHEMVVLDGCWIGMEGGDISPVENLARHFSMCNCHIFGSVNSEFGLVNLSTSRHANHVELTNNMFYARSSALRYVVDKSIVDSFAIEEVDGNDLLFADTAANFELTHRQLAKHVHVWRDDGAKQGVVNDAVQDGPKIRLLFERWSDLPVSGETWHYRDLSSLRLDGNTLYDGASAPIERFPLFPNRSGIKTVTLDGEAMVWETDILNWPVDGILHSVRISVHPNQSVDVLKLRVAGTESVIDMSTVGVREISFGGVIELGADILINSWAGNFCSNLELYLQNGSHLPHTAIVTLQCEIEGL